jgi:hypothetical protein
MGIAGQKPGALMFALIPTGHKAPTHTHLSPEALKGMPPLPGEITVSWFGTLKYPVEDRMLTHTLSDPPRISPPGSIDAYPVQDELWAGAYIQFVQCDIAR